MQIGIVGDLHLGISYNTQIFNSQVESQSRSLDFIRQEFHKKNIDTILFMGDIFDDAKFCDASVLTNLILKQFRKFSSEFKSIVILMGNHDKYYKDSLDVSFLSILELFPNIKIIDKITTVDGIPGLLVPWLTTETEKEFINNIDKYSCDIVFGHFGICGFPYDAGNVAITGISPDLFFTHFKKTISGHYHTPSYKEENGSSIRYVGSPYQLTFGECGNKNCVYLLDTETLELEEIENTVSNKFISFTDDYILSHKKEDFNLNNCYVRLQYDSNISSKEFYLICELIEKKNPIVFRKCLKKRTTPKEILEESVSDDKTYDKLFSAIASNDIHGIVDAYKEANPISDSGFKKVDEVLDILKKKI